MTGWAARPSTRKKAVQAATAPAARARMTGSDQAYSVPPQLAKRTVQVTAAAIRAIPGRSTVTLVRGRGGSLMATAATAKARAPRGRLIQNAQRQECASVNQPPSSGPTTEARPKTAPIGAMYLARSRGGTRSAMIACEVLIRPPPPSPCTARPAIRVPMSGAIPQITEPARKRAIPPRNRALRPIRSPILP